MKRKPHAGSVANRSGDRNIISASLTGKHCPCPRRFPGDHIPKRKPPIHAMLGAPACSRLSAIGTLNAGHRPALHGCPACSRKIPEFSAVVPAFSTGIQGHSHGIPGHSPAVPASSSVVPKIPQKSQPFPPSCRLFPGNPTVFPRIPAPFPRNPQGSRRFPRRFISTSYLGKPRIGQERGRLARVSHGLKLAGGPPALLSQPVKQPNPDK